MRELRRLYDIHVLLDGTTPEAEHAPARPATLADEVRDLLARAGYPSEPGADGLGEALRAFVGAENLEARWWHEARLDPVVLDAPALLRRGLSTAAIYAASRTGAPGRGGPSVAAIVGGGVVTGTGVRSRISSQTARAEASGPHADAVRDARLEQAAHVLDGDLGGVVEQRGRLRAAVHREQRARRGADEHVGVLPGGAEQAHEVGAHRLGGRQLRDHLLQLHHVARRHDRIALVEHLAGAEAHEQVALAVLGRVSDARAHREAVAGGVRHLERAGVVVRVHGADAEERPWQGVAALADRHGVLLHGLEQARLHARRRAVELVAARRRWRTAARG